VNQSDLVDLFLQRAAASGARAERVEGPSDLDTVILSALEEAGLIFCPGITEKEMAVSIPEHRRTKDYRMAAITIEEVLGGIAETGSLICSNAGGKALQANMLPEHHIAILAREKIFPTLESFFRSTTELPSHLSFITGPSRTSDIEKTLIIGVHGPQRVTILVW